MVERHLDFPKYSASEKSSPYQIRFKELKGFQPKEQFDESLMIGAKWSMYYSVTLYNRDLDKRGNFHGRTYKSYALPMEKRNNSYDCNNECYVMFHTNYKQKNCYAFVEVIIEMESRG